MAEYKNFSELTLALVVSAISGVFIDTWYFISHWYLLSNCEHYSWNVNNFLYISEIWSSDLRTYNFVSSL